MCVYIYIYNVKIYTIIGILLVTFTDLALQFFLQKLIPSKLDCVLFLIMDIAAFCQLIGQSKRPKTFSWTHIGQGPYLLYPQIKYSTSSTCDQNSNLAWRCHCKIRGNNVKPHRGWLHVYTYTCMQMPLNSMLKQYLSKFSHFLCVRTSGWASVKRHCFPVDIGNPVAMDHPRALDVCRPTGELAKWNPVRCWLRVGAS